MGWLQKGYCAWTEPESTPPQVLYIPRLQSNVFLGQRKTTGSSFAVLPRPFARRSHVFSAPRYMRVRELPPKRSNPALLASRRALMMPTRAPISVIMLPPSGAVHASILATSSMSNNLLPQSWSIGKSKFRVWRERGFGACRRPSCIGKNNADCSTSARVAVWRQARATPRVWHLLLWPDCGSQRDGVFG